MFYKEFGGSVLQHASAQERGKTKGENAHFIIDSIEVFSVQVCQRFILFYLRQAQDFQFTDE